MTRSYTRKDDKIEIRRRDHIYGFLLIDGYAYEFNRYYLPLGKRQSLIPYEEWRDLIRKQARYRLEISKEEIQKLTPFFRDEANLYRDASFKEDRCFYLYNDGCLPDKAVHRKKYEARLEAVLQFA
ncbi:hypothetical protein QNI19_17700 [Cytophagaceae bacterium DM2B3-1]|uniref:Uncharacterized protein n=1 Tax=Xanthocytophaga flava TaxID=3048013 RepID=A0ABT7CLZ4_9BACT|nr:hypothetical protein [Xanthocytophaga flavus]MDJ1494778.1 hypothetical protein [Xanthocytophaga flavus]